MKTTLVALVSKSVVALLFCLAPACVYAQGNLVVNGSFEDAGGSANGWALKPGSPWYLIIATLGNGLPTNFPDGNHVGVFTYGGATISQTLATVPGVYYTLAFSAIQFSGTNFATDVSINANLLAAIEFQNYTFVSPINTSYDYSLFNSNWERFSFSFQATNTATVLSFYESTRAYAAADQTIYESRGGLDNISVYAIPEPSAWALLGLGVAGWSVRRRC